MNRFLTTLTAIATLMLSACSAVDEPLPIDTINNLSGQWQQVDGKTRVQFYQDESVMLVIPDEKPPVKLLSRLETIKDDQLGFSIGDRWSGPVHVLPEADWQHLILLFPTDNPKEEGRKVTFTRVNP